jgi:hypothetical protein
MDPAEQRVNMPYAPSAVDRAVNRVSSVVDAVQGGCMTQMMAEEALARMLCDDTVSVRKVLDGLEAHGVVAAAVELMGAGQLADVVAAVLEGIIAEGADPGDVSTLRAAARRFALLPGHLPDTQLVALLAAACAAARAGVMDPAAAEAFESDVCAAAHPGAHQQQVLDSAYLAAVREACAPWDRRPVIVLDSVDWAPGVGSASDAEAQDPDADPFLDSEDGGDPAADAMPPAWYLASTAFRDCLARAPVQPSSTLLDRWLALERRRPHAVQWAVAALGRAGLVHALVRLVHAPSTALAASEVVRALTADGQDAAASTAAWLAP